MSDIKRSKELNLDEIKKAASEQGVLDNDFHDDETEVVGSDWMNSLNKTPEKHVTKPEPVQKINNETTIAKEAPTIRPNLESKSNVIVEEVKNEELDELYTGSGLVINNNELQNEEEEHLTPGYTGVTPDTQSNIDAYLKEMDAEIEELKSEQVEITKSVKEEEPDEDETESEEMTEDEFNRKYDEAVIIIDKTGFGQVIDFTDSEREKLERSKKIKLEEVENVTLESIKTKKKKKNLDIDQVIKKVTKMCSANIVLPASGYTAVMKGCSAHELITLIKGGDNVMTELQSKWSLIYDKIESTSLGEMSYNDFLLNTASVDMNIFIYGILCATYPDDDTIPLNCTKCGKEFTHSYSIKSLIRAEKIEPRLQDLIMNAVDNSYTVDAAKEAHDRAPVSIVKKIKLPVSEIIMELYVQSAYDLINKSAKELAKNDREAKYEEASIISTTVNKVYIPDLEENDGSYFEVEDVMDVVKTIYALSDTDNEVLTKLANDMLEGLTIEFGLMDITCPSCKHFTASIPMDIDQILFYKYQQARSTTVE